MPLFRHADDLEVGGIQALAHNQILRATRQNAAMLGHSLCPVRHTPVNLSVLKDRMCRCL